MTNKMFANNVGAADRTIRVLLGIVLLALTIVGPRTPWGWIGVIPLLTGLLGTCPIYSALRISTAKHA